MKQILKNKRFRAAFRISLLVLAATVIGLNLYSLNAASLTGNAVPMPFGVGASVVLSGSMEPELSTGDLIFIAERDSYQKDDVIVFQDGSMAVAHRIVSINEEEVITRGDANNTSDAPFHPDRIKGEVVFAIPFVGYLVNIIKTPIGTLVILGLAIFLLERSFRAKKKEDQKKLDDIKAEIEKLKQENH